MAKTLQKQNIDPQNFLDCGSGTGLLGGAIRKTWPLSHITGIDFAEDAYAAAEGVDCLVLVTEWNEFRSLDLARLKSIMNTPVLVDLRNVYRHDEVTRQGFSYSSVGRPENTGIDLGQAEAAE